MILSIYLDNSATTAVSPFAASEMYKMLTENFGNPSSTHAAGLSAAAALETARERIAHSVGCDTSEIYFSSGGTAANNTAIFGTAERLARRGKRIITTALEHPSVGECMDKLEGMGFEVIRLKPDSDGQFPFNDFRRALNDKTILVSVMYVNNEIGVINPIKQIAKTVRLSGAPALVHCDAVQAFSKLSVKPSALGVDLMSLSSHKIHGPKGAGALYIRRGVAIRPHLVGGGQENKMFSGTEPLPAIVGFGAAASEIRDISANLEKTKQLKQQLLELLSASDKIVINSPSDSLPYIINLSLLGVPSEVTVNHLSSLGIYISAGSACKKGHRSDVLSALGLPPKRIDSAVRISLSDSSSPEEISSLANALLASVSRFSR